MWGQHVLSVCEFRNAGRLIAEWRALLYSLNSSPGSPLELASQNMAPAISLETAVLVLEVISTQWESSSLQYHIV